MESNPAKHPNITSAAAIPEHIIIEEILPRLPVKSLLRFKCVSKQWLYTISKSPSFSKLYLKFSSSQRRQFLMMMSPLRISDSNCNEFYSLSYQDTCTNAYDFDLRRLGEGDDVDETRIVGSCNGLVCLYYERSEDGFTASNYESKSDRPCYFMIWNPATRQSRDIDSPPGVSIALATGYGYVASLDDYKIVASFAIGRIFKGLYMFSLRTGKWDKVIDGYPCNNNIAGLLKGFSDETIMKRKEIASMLKREGLGIDDTLYWPPSKWSCDECIVGFNLVNKEFKKYTIFKWQIEYDKIDLFRFKGGLGFRGRHRAYNVCDFWMLKSIDDWNHYNSWQKMISVDLKKAAYSLTVVSETGKCLVTEAEFVLVDLCKEALELCTRRKYQSRSPFIEKTVDHVDSLVSPFGTIESNEEDDNVLRILRMENF